MKDETPIDGTQEFQLGRIVVTPGVIEKLRPTEVFHALQRHALGDWGDIHKNDIGLNEEALVHGGRLLSVYYTSSGTRFWIITEADRSATTVLLPEEY